MGCSNNKAIRIYPRKKKSGATPTPPDFIIKIENPLTFEIVTFTYNDDNDEELPLVQIMNGIAFDESEQGKKFDANFISLYNKDRDEYDYYVERLIGISIEHDNNPKAGMMWVCYINKKREEWTFLCENNRIVTKDDDILWRYEKYVTADKVVLSN
jgi:hypothetical protein